jgi:hypothetical protein
MSLIRKAAMTVRLLDADEKMPKRVSIYLDHVSTSTLGGWPISATIINLSHPSLLVIVPTGSGGTGSGFPASRCWQVPRVRFSLKENRMQFIKATGLHRKSGGTPQERSGGICSAPRGFSNSS